MADMAGELKKERRDNIMYTEEKFQLRNNGFYGSYMQDNKYIKPHNPSRAYKTYMKGQQN